jgi:lipopolysaccharide/colanic/teichoic acid biosynthesis glycosyltransferase
MGHAWAKLPVTGRGTVVAEAEDRRITPSAGFYIMFGKRLIDVSLSLVLLALLSPIMAVTLLALRLELGRGLVISQRRVGKCGVPFAMLKLRTMHRERRTCEAALYTGPERRVSHKCIDDPRHTRVGRVVRRWSLDEVPQLINVIRGEMSLVGPRPELAIIVQEYEPWQHSRHLVKPGVTGLWQTTARRQADELMRYRTDIDIDYIQRLSFRTDLAILMRTPFAMRFGR